MPQIIPAHLFTRLALFICLAVPLSNSAAASEGQELAQRYGAYVKLPSMGFSLFSPNKDEVMAYMIITPAFETSSEQKSKDAIDRLASIQDAIINKMHIYLSLFWRPDRVVNQKHLEYVVHEAIKEVVQEDLKNVYVNDVRINRAKGKTYF